MRTFFTDLLIPICAALVAAAAASEICKKTAPVLLGRFAEIFTSRFKGIKLALAVISAGAAAQMVLLILTDILLTHFTIGDPIQPALTAGSTGISAAAMIAFCLLTDAALLAVMFGKQDAVKTFFRRTAIASCVLLLAECFLFGGKSLTAHPYYYRLGELTLSDNAEYAGGGDFVWFTVNGESGAVECMPKQDTRSLSINMKKDEENRMIQVTAYIKDGNFSRSWQQAEQRWFAANGETVTLNFDPYATLHGVRLVFSNIGDPLSVYDITESPAPPFRFMTARYLFWLLFAAAVIAVHSFELHRVIYDRQNKKHRILLAVITAACICSPLLLATNQELPKYDPDNNYASEDVFIKTFDALQHGQANLRMFESPDLAALSDEELYDNSVRSELNISYSWDHAFKDGKYYSYFGITPIVTLYYPMYWLSGKLPTLEWAIMFYSVFAAAFTCLAVIAGVTLLVKKPNLLMLALSLPASVAAVGIFYTIQFHGMYVLPVASAICFLMLTLWMGFSACMQEKKVRMYVQFGISGLALGLCAGARPSVAISAAILIPLFLGILMNREAKWKDKLLKAGVFAAPLFAVVCGLLVYNHARFGSYTDFGAQYQLTVSNINANNLRLYALPDGIYHYMLQPPDTTGSFPFFSLSWQGIANYERYRFTYKNVGVFWLPMLACGLLLLRTACTGNAAESPLKTVTALQKKAVLITGFAAALIVAWMDFCLAGNGTQYIFDIAPILCVVSAIVLVTAAKPEAALRYRISWVSCVCTVLAVMLFMAGMREGVIHEKYPLLYQTAESMIVFWH